jgi:hypothetical protein
VLAEDVRRLALDLPEAVEKDHHGRPSFRVRDRIFATLWTSATLNVMPGEEAIKAAVAQSPASCSEFFWGKRLRAVHIELAAADHDQVEDLLWLAWSQRAPRRLLAQ